jgi:hypothetical protein
MGAYKVTNQKFLDNVEWRNSRGAAEEKRYDDVARLLAKVAGLTPPHVVEAGSEVLRDGVRRFYEVPKGNEMASHFDEEDSESVWHGTLLTRLRKIVTEPTLIADDTRSDNRVCRLTRKVRPDTSAKVFGCTTRERVKKGDYDTALIIRELGIHARCSLKAVLDKPFNPLREGQRASEEGYVTGVEIEVLNNSTLGLGQWYYEADCILTAIQSRRAGAKPH